jgi:hypothetical protein
MLFRKLLEAALLSAVAVQDVSARALAGKPQHFVQPYRRGEPLQDIVTWDEHSLLIRGERVMLYSGEFHPVSLSTGWIIATLANRSNSSASQSQHSG